MSDTLKLNRKVTLNLEDIPLGKNELVVKNKGPNLPKAQAGIVICYSYLWKREAETGMEEGLKNRPCVIVAVIPAKEKNEKPDVLVAPITHSNPMNNEDRARVVEISPEEKHLLGMDDLPSYICCSELNRFKWPGDDLQLIPGGKAYTFGLMRPGTFKQIKTKVQEIRSNIVQRDLIDAPEHSA